MVYCIFAQISVNPSQICDGIIALPSKVTTKDVWYLKMLLFSKLEVTTPHPHTHWSLLSRCGSYFWFWWSVSSAGSGPSQGTLTTRSLTFNCLSLHSIINPSTFDQLKRQQWWNSNSGVSRCDLAAILQRRKIWGSLVRTHQKDWCKQIKHYTDALPGGAIMWGCTLRQFRITTLVRHFVAAFESLS